MPVTVRPPHPQNLATTLPTVKMIVEVTQSAVLHQNANVIPTCKVKTLTRLDEGIVYIVHNDVIYMC